jgi:hypothetical protein
VKSLLQSRLSVQAEAHHAHHSEWQLTGLVTRASRTATRMARWMTVSCRWWRLLRHRHGHEVGRQALEVLRIARIVSRSGRLVALD